MLRLVSWMFKFVLCGGFIFFSFLLTYFWCHWVFVAVHGLSLVVESGGCLLVGV